METSWLLYYYFFDILLSQREIYVLLGSCNTYLHTPVFGSALELCNSLLFVGNKVLN